MTCIGKNIIFFSMAFLLAGLVFAGDKLVNGNWYSIKGDNNTWVSYDKESKNFKLENAQHKSRFKAIQKTNDQYVFQLSNREYLSASNDNTVTIRENPWDWETFTVQEALNQKYYLRSYHGNYLRLNYDINKLDLSPNREWWEAIEFIKEAPKLIDGEQFYIEGLDAKFLSFDADSKKVIPAKADKKAAFTIITKPDNKIILQLGAGQYLSASDNGTVTIRENPWDWETFTLEKAPNQKYYLRSIHDNYLRINYHTNQIDLSPYREDWEALKFIPALPLDNALIEELKQNHQERLDFLNSSNESKIAQMLCFGGVCLTALEKSSVPKTAFLQNYNTSTSRPFLISCFPISFLPYVPKRILDELEFYKVAPENITLCWNVQATTLFGGAFTWGEGAELDNNTTRLKAHGFAAPNAPENFTGDLVNRNFLFGIYDGSDQAIADADLKFNQLKSFPVHVHDNRMSPPEMARIALTEESPSQYFWSLIIDNEPPEGQPVRANVTLHWLLSYEEVQKGEWQEDKIQKEMFWLNKQKWTYSDPTTKHIFVRDMTFKQLLTDLKNDSIINDSVLMPSLRVFLSDIWKDIH